MQQDAPTTTPTDRRDTDAPTRQRSTSLPAPPRFEPPALPDCFVRGTDERRDIPASLRVDPRPDTAQLPPAPSITLRATVADAPSQAVEAGGDEPAPQEPAHRIPFTESLGLRAEPDDEVAPADSRPATIPLLLLTACAVVLVVAAHMSGSVAAIACAGLVLADLAASLARASTTAGHARLVAVAALALVAFAAVKLPHQFSDMAFVAGLFVMIAIVPVLVLHGVAMALVRRDAGAAGRWLWGSQAVRWGALALTAAAAVQAHRTYVATPDTLVAIPMLGLVAWRCMSALRPAR